jgi:hypothetical protein
MSRPLPSGDPAQLGPFRLSARRVETSAGIVFLGEDDRGRQATLAVLRRGAADDPAARDRFRAAILAAVPGGGGPVVLAAQPEGPAPWVAVRYEPGSVGAERFLEPVALSGRWPVWRRGPGFVPYWAGQGGGPAVLSGAAAGGGVPPRGPDRGLAAAVVALAVMLALVALLMVVLFACQPEVGEPPPDPPPDTVPTSSPQPSSTPPSPSPSPSSPSPSEPSPSPGESGSPGDDGGDL